VEIAIISDTHMPRGDRRLGADCIARLRRAQVIVHAGDLIRLSVLRQLESYAPVVAVYGNVDDEEVRAALPQSTVFEANGARIGIVHDPGPRRGRLERLQSRFPDVDAVVFGHSHLPLHDHAPNGFQIFNPGSPTERRRAPVRSMGIARVRVGVPRFELIPLG
jgi:putative phosphoesterase